MWVETGSDSEFKHCCNDAGLIGFVQLVKEWQANQSVADTFRYGANTFLSSEFPSHFRQMQGRIMENAHNITLLQMGDEGLADLEERHQQEKHVPRLAA